MSTTARKEALKSGDGIPVKPPVTPSLRHGDRLTRDEFERRYDAMPNLKKAELLEGVVYIMSSPVLHELHSGPHFKIITWLGMYESVTEGVEGGDNGSIRMDVQSEPQPDAFLFILPECGGSARISSDMYLEGTPELVVEVSASIKPVDLGVKLQVYRRNGVKEYIVWRTMDREIDWFVLREGTYEPMSLPIDGIYRSTVFPGLWLNVPAVLAGDLADIVNTVQAGTQSKEHAEFVEELNRRRQSTTEPTENRT